MAIVMVVTLMPAVAEDADALTGSSNISLNAEHVNLYTDSPSRCSFDFTVDMQNCTAAGATSVTWSVNEIGTPRAAVSLSSITGTSVTVTGIGAGSIEVVAYVDAQNYASAVVAVQTGYAPADEFTFYIQIDKCVHEDYLDDLVPPGDITIDDFNVGIVLSVSKADFQANSVYFNEEFNALNALRYLFDDEWGFNASDYGWIDTFLGLGTYPGENGSWIYWAQYHSETSSDGAKHWAFNNYCLGDLSTDEYSEIALFFRESLSENDLPQYPFMPAEDPNQ